MLSAPQRAGLLALARAAVAARVEGGAVPAVGDVFPDASGVFVTIKQAGELRGCLGTLACRGGLGAEVVRCAGDAASEDPRFPAVAAGELLGLSLEVSVLGPLERIDPREPDAIAIGAHGLVVEQGGARGLLLPQVAVEWNWTPREFLDRTCVKAGLAPGAWQRGATVYRFTADVFGDA
jgi:AmmeMemoRadiSam system protein A